MEIRPLGVDDLDAAMDSAVRAFGPLPVGDRDQWRDRVGLAAADGRQLGAFDGARLVATTRVIDFRQCWHGRPVSMGGIGGVTVAPEERGRGVGRRIVAEALRLCEAKGHALSMLYPATTPIYRSLGWEHVGGYYSAKLSAEGLRTLGGEPVPVRRATREDAAEVAATLRRVHEAARDSGPVDWTTDMWRVKLAREGLFAYLAEDGFLAYRWDAAGTGLEVEKLVAGSEATLRTLASIVGSGSSISPTISAIIGPDDPVLWLPRERPYQESLLRTQWMLRLVDAPAAIEARGYPAGVSAEVPLHIDDPDVGANSGHWRLTVKGGEGRLERSAEDATAVRVGPRGLAALYAGLPAGTLRRSGLVEGGALDALDTLGAAFAARPFSLDHF